VLSSHYQLSAEASTAEGILKPTAGKQLPCAESALDEEPADVEADDVGAGAAEPELGLEGG